MKAAFLIADDEYHPSEPIFRALREILPSEVSIVEAEPGEIGSNSPDFDLMIVAKMNVQSKVKSEPWVTFEFEQWLSKWISDGGRLLVLHAGLARYGGVVRELVGGTFLSHPAQLEVEYRWDRGMIRMRDEHYFVDVDPECEVFLTSHSEAGEQPAGWRRTVVNGKVLALTPSHNEENWESPFFRALLKQEISWLLS